MAIVRCYLRLLLTATLFLITNVGGQGSDLDLGPLEPCISAPCPLSIDLNEGSQAPLSSSYVRFDGFSNCCV